MSARLGSLQVRAADLHAADARYHRDCYCRFFKNRSPPGDAKVDTVGETDSCALQYLIKEMLSNRSQLWDSVQLMERYTYLGGKAVRRIALISALCDRIDDIVVLSAPGYRSVVFFRDCTIATLKMKRDDDGDDNLDAALNIVAKNIKKNVWILTMIIILTRPKYLRNLQLNQSLVLCKICLENFRLKKTPYHLFL